MAKQINEAKFDQVRALLVNTMCEYIGCFVDAKTSGAYYDPDILLNKILDKLCESDKVMAIKTLRTAVQDMKNSLTFNIAQNDDLRNAFVRAVIVVNEHGSTKMTCSVGEYSATIYFAQKHFGLKDAKDLVDLIDNILVAGDMYLQA